MPKTKSEYAKANFSAVTILETAIAFAEDGAQLDAIRCASEAINLLVKAAAAMLFPGRKS